MIKRRKRHYFKKIQILLLVLLAFSFLFLYDCWRIKQGYPPYLKRWFPLQDYTFQSHQIDMAIESSLSNLGLTSEDIIKSYREEKETGKTKWIDFYKELKVPFGTDFSYYTAVIGREVEKVGGTILTRQLSKKGEDSLTLVIGVENISTATLIFRAIPRAKIAIIIDDVGYGGPVTEKLLQLPFTATLSILPHLAHSGDIAEEAHSLGYEVMLHLPMESIRPEENRGMDIIYVDMNKEEIVSLIEEALDSVPYAVGVNNHMGSRLCQNSEAMEIILDRIKGHNLYFIDSLVITDSVAYKIAQTMAIPSNYRRTFLDNHNDPDYIKGQLAELKEKAIAEGEAIGIGHCRRNTLDVLAEVIPEMKKEGIKFVFASELVK